jgi:regulator of cell morphogenesis and NO signaling
MNNIYLSGDIRMADLLIPNNQLLYILPHFGIELGFGEQTVAQTCEEHGVSLPLFLLVCNLYSSEDYIPNNFELKKISIEQIVEHLHNAQKYFLKTSLPQLIDNILKVAELHIQNENKNMLVAFCEKYHQDAIAHVQYEEEVVFPHIRRLLAGEKSDYKISEFANHHGNLDSALRDLRNIVIKYMPHTCPFKRSVALLNELYLFELILRNHLRMEDTVLIPLVEQLSEGKHGSYDSAGLSERERQTLTALARGLSNKQIAETMGISIHTVVAHRKNIVRKTGINTAQGLTLYAFVNGMITEKDLL